MFLILDENAILFVFAAVFGLLWGSFLNVVAFRLAFDLPFWRPRSHCPQCDRQLRWFELLPLVSWIFLHGRCRTCKAPISKLYPTLELLGGISFGFLFITFPLHFVPLLALFISALLVSFRTDCEQLVIFRYCTLFIIPLAWLGAWLNLLPISLSFSLLGTILGYGILWLVRFVSKLITGRIGMGIGDVEMLAMIGAFLGPFGLWSSLFVASCIGSLIGVFMLIQGKATRTTPLPFGAFLALGGLISLFLVAPFTTLF